MPSNCHSIIGSLAALLLATAAACAQPIDGFGDLGRTDAGGGAPGSAAAGAAAAGSWTEGGKRLAVERVHGAGIDFQPGRDNLGFPNLSGAVRLGGMAGNCYTMAFVAKLFFEDARFRPSASGGDDRAGFTLADLSAHLAGDRGASLEVRDFASLHEMSWDPGFGETEAFDFLARQRGIEMGMVADELSGKRKMILQLIQVISTVHYLHYMQYQAGSFLEAILRQKMAGAKQVRAVTAREVSAMATQLGRGKSCLLLMLNVDDVYGHVVLAYRIVDTAAARYVLVYDSNVQHGEEKRPSALKISKDGVVEGYYRVEPGGQLTPDGIYDGDSWFSKRDSLAILNLPDLTLNPENRKSLARKTEAAGEETAILLASGQLLKRLTESPPDKTSLRDDLAQFLRNLQSIQATAPGATGQVENRLGPNASVSEINRLLERRADAAIRTAFPYALPKGMALTETRLRLDETDPNRMELATTLTLEKDGPVHRLAGVLQESAALSGYGELAAWIEATRENVGPTKVRATVELELTKQRMPAGLQTEFGLMPRVKKSHIVLGDLAPSKRLPTDHQLEISKEALRGGLKTALSRINLVGQEWRFDYILVPARYSPSIGGHQVQLVPEVKRYGRFGLDSVGLDLVEGASGGRLRLIVAGNAFIAVNPVLADKGVSGVADPVHIDVRIFRGSRQPEAHWSLFATVEGKLAFDDGLFNILARPLTLLATELFPYVRDHVNAYIKDQLSDRVKLVQPIQVRNVKVTTRTLSLDTGAAVVDVDLLAKDLFQSEVPVSVKNFETRRDRVVIGSDYR